MVEFGHQPVLLFLGPLSLGYVNIDAHDPLWAPIAIVRHEAARLDPSNFAARTNNAVLNSIFAPALPESIAADCLEPIEILRMCSGFPFAAGSGSPRQSVERSIA